MKSNVFDERGEQTHVLLDMEDYEQLKLAEKKLRGIRDFAQGMMSQLQDVAEPPEDEAAARGDSLEEEEPQHNWG